MPASDPFPVLCLLQSHLEALAGRGQRRLWLNTEARQALREIVRMKPSPWTPEMVAAAAAGGSIAESGTPAPSGEESGAENTAGIQATCVAMPGTDAAVAAPSPAASEGNLADTASRSMEQAADIPVSTAEQALNLDGAGPEPILSADEPRKSVLREDAEDAEWTDEGDDSDDAGTLPGSAEGSAAAGSEEASRPLTLAAKETLLAAVRERAEEGRTARALGTLRNRMVFAVGRADAEIVFVGEAPGAEEERLGEPFVGPAGQLLNRILNAMGLQRGEVYISNICKFRPEMENQGSRNRQPSGLEMASCMDFVREEIRIIQPKVVVALGATAAAGLLDIKTGVMSARGRFYEFEGIPAMVTLHPSYLLHREKDGPEVANAEKRKVWEDMLQVMERAGLPVSDKQRRFFLPR